MDKKILYEVLISKSERLSAAEIEGIMFEELDKSPEEMDTDLIDLCLDALDSVDEKQLNMKKHRIRLTKVLLVAVIFVLIIGACIPACAKFMSINVPDGIVSIYKDCFNVDISDNKNVDDILGQLENDGVTNATLPKKIYYSDTKIYDYSLVNKDTITFNFNFNDINGYANIKKHNNSTVFSLDQKKETIETEKIEYFDIDGINVIVLSKDGLCHIIYVVDNIEYNIYIQCEFETACQIAETL